MKDFSYGNEILAKKYFKVADSEKQFINLIETYTKEKIIKKMINIILTKKYLKKFLNPHSSLNNLSYNVDLILKIIKKKKELNH